MKKVKHGESKLAALGERALQTACVLEINSLSSFSPAFGLRKNLVKPVASSTPSSGEEESEFAAIFSIYAGEASFRELIERFCQHLLQRVEELRLIYEKKEWQKLSRLAHKLKGAASTYGYPLLSQQAARLESLALSLSTEEAGEGSIWHEMKHLFLICERIIRGIQPHL